MTHCWDALCGTVCFKGLWKRNRRRVLWVIEEWNEKISVNMTCTTSFLYEDVPTMASCYSFTCCNHFSLWWHKVSLQCKYNTMIYEHNVSLYEWTSMRYIVMSDMHYQANAWELTVHFLPMWFKSTSFSCLVSRIEPVLPAGLLFGGGPLIFGQSDVVKCWWGSVEGKICSLISDQLVSSHFHTCVRVDWGRNRKASQSWMCEVKRVV